MKKSLLAVSCLALSGCATVGGNLPTGMAIINMHRGAGFATNAVNAAKTGKACSTNYLGVVATGDSSIEAAKKAGGISTVSSVDYDIQGFTFVYGQVCTIVKGN